MSLEGLAEEYCKPYMTSKPECDSVPCVHDVKCAFKAGFSVQAHRLAVAMEALEFYAEKSNWVSRSGKIGVCPIDTLDRDSYSPEYPWAGGKRAREALRKLSFIIEDKDMTTREEYRELMKQNPAAPEKVEGTKVLGIVEEEQEEQPVEKEKQED